MMAWINFDNKSGDNMVFGQAVGSPVLHQGARDGQYYMAHWGNDIGGGSIRVGEWQHVAFRYEGGTQTIFVDGNAVASDVKGGLTNEEEIAIGTTLDDEDRDFTGLLDNVRIYNLGIADGVITALAVGGGGGDPGGGGNRPGGMINVVKAASGAISFDFPADTTFNVEYSEDLVTWTEIATSVMGAYEDADAGRSGNGTGYYRGVSQ